MQVEKIHTMIQVVKIGGNVIDHPQALSDFLQDFAKIPGPKVLIHGGGKLATALSARLNIPTQMIEGRRVTDEQTLQICAMVYAGWINKSIVAGLQALGCNAIGLAGTDANLIPAQKRKPVQISTGETVDFGFVGDIDPQTINSGFLLSLTDAGITPVLSAIAHDQQGHLLNCNADTIASSVAVALAAKRPTELIFCFEKLGVLSNPMDEMSVVPQIDQSNYTDLKKKEIVSGGMIPKIDNAFKAIQNGVSQVWIKHARNLKTSIGTLIKK